ncbi:hypothetical protein ACFW04_011347 [Cataglyphis niger]
MATVEFTQINLHHSKGASAVLAKSKLATIAVNGLEAQLMSLLCSRDIAAIVMDFRRFNTGKIKKIVVSSASFPHEKENSLLPELVINLMKYCQNERPPLIVWCNASHDLRKHQLQRLGLLKYLVATNLEILNRSYEPIFQNMLTCEILDLTICSKNLVSENRARNMSRPLDWDLFRRTQKTYRDSVVTAKRESWKKFCESIEEILELEKLIEIYLRDIVLGWHPLHENQHAYGILYRNGAPLSGLLN